MKAQLVVWLCQKKIGLAAKKALTQRVYWCLVLLGSALDASRPRWSVHTDHPVRSNGSTPDRGRSHLPTNTTSARPPCTSSRSTSTHPPRSGLHASTCTPLNLHVSASTMMRSLKYSAIRAAKAVGLALLVAALLAANVLITLFMSFWTWMGYVRHCANYRPKGVALSESSEPPPKLGPQVNGVLTMVSRTKQLEGWRGLYQGATVSFVMNYLVALVSLLGVLFIVILTSQVSIPKHGEKYLFIAYIFISIIGPVLISLPFEVVLYRTMVYPRRLNWKEPKRCLRAVLSEAEIKNPWRLYTLPGVFVLLLVRQLVATGLQATPNFVLEAYRANFVHFVLGAPEAAAKLTAVRFLVLVVYSALTVALTVPIQVLIVRLATQRTASSALHAEDAAEPDVFTPRTLEPTSEPVISLRPCTEPLNEAESYYGATTVAPYTGAIDAAKKMVAEEGHESLWRGLRFISILVLFVNIGRMDQFASIGHK